MSTMATNDSVRTVVPLEDLRRLLSIPDRRDIGLADVAGNPRAIGLINVRDDRELYQLAMMAAETARYDVSVIERREDVGTVWTIFVRPDLNGGHVAGNVRVAEYVASRRSCWKMDGNMFLKFSSEGRLPEVAEWLVEKLPDGRTQMRSGITRETSSLLDRTALLEAIMRAFHHRNILLTVPLLRKENAAKIVLNPWNSPLAKPTDLTLKVGVDMDNGEVAERKLSREERRARARAKSAEALRLQPPGVNPQPPNGHKSNKRKK
jgi:hypothetical protein